jgi:hypothetical protein
MEGPTVHRNAQDFITDVPPRLKQVCIDHLERNGDLYASFHYAILGYVARTNPSNDLPYHNIYHSLCATTNILKSGYIGADQNADAVIVGMFHDFGHSGGKTSDKENVDRAIAAMHEFLDSKTVFREMPGFRRRMIEDAIRCTQFPFEYEPVFDLAQAMRDADLLQVTEPFWMQQVLWGLRQEALASGKDISVHELEAEHFWKFHQLEHFWMFW